MELNQLRYFQIVAKYEQMTRAAEELHISQSSLSKTISMLEKDVGAKLFDRMGNRIVLNAVGRAFLSRIEFGPIMDGYQEYLKLMNKWYSEGLIYQDFMSLDTFTYPQNLSNGTFGMGVIDRGQFTATQLALEATDPNADLVGCKDARKNADDVLHIQYIDHHVADGYAITTGCENVEVAARYLDYLYTEEGSILAGYGVEGEGLTFDANGDPQLSDMILNNET